MNRQHFQNEMNRLTDTFGAQHYKAERVKILWNAVEPFDNGWFTKIVTHFIGHSRQAPLMPEFADPISQERERMYDAKKQEHKKEAEDFMSGYSGQDIATICGEIVRRLKGNMPDDHFESFKSGITPSGQKAFRCERCQDSGAWHDPEKGGMWKCDHKLRRVS